MLMFIYNLLRVNLMSHLTKDQLHVSRLHNSNPRWPPAVFPTISFFLFWKA